MEKNKNKNQSKNKKQNENVKKVKAEVEESKKGKNILEIIKSVVFVILIAFLCLSSVGKTLENDTFFTIAGGRLILENGIETEEKLVWHEGLEFTNSRWLFDILITLIYENWNFDGVYVFVALMAILQGLLYYRVILKITDKKTYSFFICIISMYVINPTLVARAQIISNFLLLLEFYLLETIKDIDKVKIRYKLLFLIMPIIFANAHASTYPMYLVLFLPYIAEYIASKLPFSKSDDRKIIYETKNIKYIIIFFIVGILAGFIVPNGVKPYSDMFNAMEGISSSIIVELKPFSIYDNLYLTTIIISTIAILIFSKQKLRVSDGLFILGFSLLALKTRRCFAYFILIASICFARILIEFLATYDFKIDFIPKKLRILGLTLSLIFVIVFSTNFLLRNISEEVIPYNVYPIKACDYILKNLDVNTIRIFNHFNYGSYLEFRGIKAFIDSRSGIFTDEFNEGCTVLEDWNDIDESNVDYNKIFDKYNITHLLLSNNEKTAMKIKEDPNWNCIYQDDSFILYERKSN